MENLSELQGLDIYLIDQIVKGRYAKDDLILDAGCGSGRNMRWFANQGYTIAGCDRDVDQIEKAIETTGLSDHQFVACQVEKMPYQDEYFDHLISCAVLHFAANSNHFIAMIKEMHRVLKPNGTLFIRMNATIGLPQNYQDLGQGRFLLQDGSERFLLTKTLLQTVESLGFFRIEPLKSLVVEELRTMATLVLQKVG